MPPDPPGRSPSAATAFTPRCCSRRAVSTHCGTGLWWTTIHPPTVGQNTPRRLTQFSRYNATDSPPQGDTPHAAAPRPHTKAHDVNAEAGHPARRHTVALSTPLSSACVCRPAFPRNPALHTHPGAPPHTTRTQMAPPVFPVRPSVLSASHLLHTSLSPPPRPAPPQHTHTHTDTVGRK